MHVHPEDTRTPIKSYSNQVPVSNRAVPACRQRQGHDPYLKMITQNPNTLQAVFRTLMVLKTPPSRRIIFIFNFKVRYAITLKKVTII